MTLVSRTLSSGFVVAEHGFDEAQLQRALTQIDGDYVLWPPDATSPYYRVMCRVSDWQPAVPVVTWMGANGEPLPLSSGLIDEVQKWRPENRGKRGLTADEHNERQRADARRLQDENLQAIHEEFAPHLERSRTVVQMGDKQRPSYMRNRHLPDRIRKH